MIPWMEPLGTCCGYLPPTMATAGRTAVIAGATGLVGGHVLGLLLEDANYTRVISASRRPVHATPAKLEQHIVDFATLPEMPPADDAFCCLGTTIRRAGSQEAFRQVDYDYVLSFANAAHRAGATQLLLVSAVGADPAARVFYSRVKGEVEAAVRQIPFAGIQIFRPSLLLGERSEFRLGERVATWFAPVAGLALVGSLRRYLPIEAADVARAMLRAAREAPRGPNVFEYDAIIALAKA
jgi:uncharacterized protein YbjT (DUF2867 family)